MMHNLEELLAGARRVAVAGHVKPDGDCTGSCLATYNYIKEYHPDIQAGLYLEPIPNIFKFLLRADEIISDMTDLPRLRRRGQAWESGGADSEGKTGGLYRPSYQQYRIWR